MHSKLNIEPVSPAAAAAARAAGIDPENVGFAILRLIREYGIDTIFGIPGTHNLELYRPLSRLGMRAVTTRHEQGAGFAADGWSQRKRLPGIVITTSGPGLLNVLSAAGNAFCESRPLLILTPGPARGEEFADVGTMHETKNQVLAADATVQWARRVKTTQEAVEAVHDAFQLFRTSRPRPVVIEIPIDLLQGPHDADPVSLLARPVQAPIRAADTAILAATDLLRHAKRPAILAGGGTVTACTPLRQLAERLGAAVVCTMNGKGALPESHALSIGSELRLQATQDLLSDADVLLVVGSKVSEAKLWGGTIAPQGKVIRVDILESQCNKNLVADIPLVGDAGAVLSQLDAALRSSAPRDPAWDLDAVRAELAAQAAAFAPVEYALARRIAAVLPKDAIVAGDSSQISYSGMAATCHPDEPGAFLYTPTYSTLGYGLPAAIGAKLAEPSRPVVGVIGDGALMFSVQEFQTAVEQNLDLTVICVDNGGYAEIRQNEIDRGIVPIGVDLTQPNWPALVEAFGGTGFEVERSEDLENVLQAALRTSGLTLVHVPLGLYA